MKNEYRSIFEKLKLRGGNQKYEWFQACGDSDLKNGLMVVGKAVNGWHQFQIAEKDFEDLYEEKPEPLGQNGDVEAFFRENSCSSKKYNMNRSAFWRTVRNTAKGLFDCNDRNFGKYIIYSDLYKIALPGKKSESELETIGIAGVHGDSAERDSIMEASLYFIFDRLGVGRSFSCEFRTERWPDMFR